MKDTSPYPKARYYIAGPMRGYRDFNHPAFDAAAKEWRARGYEVVNPAEIEREHPLPDDVIPGSPAAMAIYMQNDLTALLSCDAIALLPGWVRSQGATAEAFVAFVTGKPAYDAITFEPIKPAFEVKAGLLLHE